MSDVYIVVASDTGVQQATVIDPAPIAVSVAGSSIAVNIANDGPQGPKGNDAGLLTVIAGETISGGSVVMINSDGKAYKFVISNEANYGKVCGIAKQGVTVGNSIDIYIAGVVTEVGSGWTAGSVYYVSATGVLTTTPPSPGIVKLIGVGVAVDSVLLNGTMELVSI